MPTLLARRAPYKPIQMQIVSLASLASLVCLTAFSQPSGASEALLLVGFSLQPQDTSPMVPKAERNVDGIMDNSFLVEEAYNQEAGVVQHIFNGIYSLNKARGSDDHAFDFVFTQEWPVLSQKHQFSYTIPYSFVETGGFSKNGIGDMLLNYRYQAYLNEGTLTAFAPRFSLVLPTGDKDKGFGDDTLGYQWNLPFSTAVGSRWFAHANAGLTYLPSAASANDRDLLHYHLGASTIYAPTRDLHFLLEWIGLWNEGLGADGNLEREFEAVISPGMRRAFNLANEAQLVLGVGVPIGLTASAPDVGVFLYLSFEHGFLRAK
ncbi:MAG: transporter [Verrucomicrobia bacterium]|nr:transporter [Verrucomicrobiota bacterium]